MSDNTIQVLVTKAVPVDFHAATKIAEAFGDWLVRRGWVITNPDGNPIAFGPVALDMSQVPPVPLGRVETGAFAEAAREFVKEWG